MGVEADVVLLLDVDGSEWAMKPRNLYVAASRARLRLHVFVKNGAEVPGGGRRPSDPGDGRRAGFRAALRAQGYATMIAIGRELPDVVLQVGEEPLMYFEVASTRSGTEQAHGT